MRQRMETHDLDGFSLVAGLVFVAIGALVLVDAIADHDVDPLWIVAALLVGLGLAGVLGSLEWSRPGRRLERELARDDLDEPVDELATDEPRSHESPTPEEDAR